MKTITKMQAYREMARSNGQIFKVTFVKRTTGEKRLMTCRLGVKKHLQGGVKSFDDVAKDLLTVFDMSKKAYRSINLKSLLELSISGDKFTIED